MLEREDRDRTPSSWRPTALFLAFALLSLIAAADTVRFWAVTLWGWL